MLTSEADFGGPSPVGASRLFADSRAVLDVMRDPKRVAESAVKAARRA
jgi:hypothetical protein